VNDLDERAWWVIEMPDAIVYVPAETFEAAQKNLVANCYAKAPVEGWPLICSRYTSRAAIIKAALGRPVLPCASDPRSGK
jgi:hypothetical protein